MSFVIEEIASQPGCWQRAAEMAGGVAGLPAPGERVAVVGCGTSLFIAQAYAALREAAGAGESDAFPASEFPRGRTYDRVVVICRSGTTTEVLELLRATTLPTVAVIGDPRTPIVAAADTCVVLDFADERSVVQTRFATTALVLLRAHLGLLPDDLIEQCRAAIEWPLPAGALARGQFTFLGAGWTNGIANEAALKVREAAGAWTESYPAMEYRHGPISVSDERSLVWFFGTPPAGLVKQVERTGALVEDAETDPLADLVRVQRLAVALAESKDLDPDQPRNLTRSIILS
ncbi:SIS domain-containing protein [Spirillospora sp. NPDC048911]|uniref:SIS domain-containing protein n=1 Tax=Spirillospora sp. NPDC048911 TaxID=3364527 RepID=UPI0037127BD6